MVRDASVRDAVLGLAARRRGRTDVDGVEARNLRVAAGITVGELAAVIGVSGPTLSRMELGALKGSAPVRERWAEAVAALREAVGS
jgi:predicted transcriptional regulator